MASTEADLGLGITEGGGVAIAATGTPIPTEPGDMIMAGTLNTANFATGGMGGQVMVLGDRVALADQALIQATGNMDGGTVFIGGNYQGIGSLSNAQQTYIGPDATITADAGDTGNGGTVIVWADGQTAFYGNISASGGSVLGNGGFVEVSGKQNLIFRGNVALDTINGLPGTLLLDPTDIIIADGTGAINDTEISDNQIFANDGTGTFTISEAQLEALDGDAQVILQATNDIRIRNLTDDALEFQVGAGSIEFIADADSDGVGAFLMSDRGQNDGIVDTDGIADTIFTNGRDIFIAGASLNIGNINTSLNNTIAIALEPFPSGEISNTSAATFTFLVTTEDTAGATVQDVDVEFSADHTYVGDLRTSLSNPNGTTVVLFSGVGGAGENFEGTVFDDEASISIAEAEAPFDGTFQPQESLSAFDRQNPVGTWTLTVEDDFSLDSGNLIADGTYLLLTTDTTIGDGGSINLTATDGDIRVGNLDASSRGGVGGDIHITATGGDVRLVNSELISDSVTDSQDNYSLINIEAFADSANVGGLVLLNGAEISVENTGNGYAGDIFLDADARITVQDSHLSSNGNFGRIFIGSDGSSLETVSIRGSQITASNSNIGGTQDAGDIQITAQDSIFLGEQSTLSSNTVGTADGGFIRLTAGNKITIDGGVTDAEAAPQANIDVSTSGDGAGGNVGLDAPTVILRNGALLNASTTGNGTGGNILIGPITEVIESQGPGAGDIGIGIDIDREVAIANRTVTLQNDSIIQANAINPQSEAITVPTVTGNGGLIAIRANAVSLDDSEISTRVQLEASGEGGNIDMEADHIRLANESRIDAGTSGRMIANDPESASGGEVFLSSTGGIELINDSIISVGTELNGLGGQIDLAAQYVSLQGNSVLDASTQGDNAGGDILITTTGTNRFETIVATGALATPADRNTQMENFGVFLDNSTISTTVESGSTAQGGNVEIITDSLAIRNGGRIEAETRGAGDAGEVVLEVSRLIDIRGSNGGFNSGIAASSETPNSGASGSILINETTPQGTLTLDQNGFLSAVTRSDRADAGDITVNVANLNLLNGGQILTASTADAEAGTITVNATNQVVIEGLGTEQATEASPFNGTDGLTALVFGNTADTGLQLEFEGASYASRLGQQGNGNFAYFSFQVTEADSQGIFDIDNGVSNRDTGNIDTELFLFNQQTGELLTTNDDGDSTLGGQGSISSLDAFIDFTFAEPGDYVIGVGQFDSEATDSGLITGDAPALGQTYDLRVSLANAGSGRVVVEGANPNPNRGLGVDGAALVNSGLLAQANQGGNAGSITVNTPTLRLNHNGLIAVSSTNGSGVAGDIDITARTVTLLDGSAIAAETDAGGADASADISLSGLQTLTVEDSSISSSTQSGSAGSVYITGNNDNPADTVVVRGTNSRIAAEATTEGGLAGLVILSARDITVSGQGAEIAATNVSSREPDTAAVVLSNVENLGILDGGQITASTQTGRASNVLINLVDPINLTVDSSQSPVETLTIDGTNSRIAAEASGEAGLAGIVALSARNVTVRGEGAEIAASNVSGRVPDTAGIALVDVEHLRILDGGQITASTQTGVAGGIAINWIDPIVGRVNSDLAPVETLLISGENSRIGAEATQNGGIAGQVGIVVRDVTVRDGAEITTSNVSSQNDNTGVRLLRVEQLNVLGGGEITASTQTGIAGDVRIRGEQGSSVHTITVSGVDSQNQVSRIAARATGSGGSAGDVNISVENLVVDDGAEITASNRDFIDNSGDPSSIQLSGIRTMQVLNGGQVTAATRSGTAGNVEVIGLLDNLDNNGLPMSRIVVDGVDAQGRRSSISAQATQNGGDAGNVIFSNIGFLSILDGAEVTASTRTGTAGDIRVNNNATPANSILISGEGSLLAVEAKGPRSPSPSTTNSIRTLDIGALPVTSQANNRNDNGLGNAGDMFLFTRNLTVEDGGAITVSSAAGTAGNLEITANAILLDRGTLTASTAVDDPTRDSANIILNLGRYSLFPSDVHLENSLILQNESLIQANAQGSATGGNITINAPNGYVIGVDPTGASGSDITANAGAGNGGQVNIGAIALFGIEFRPALTPFNDITTTSAQGQAGTVTVQTLVSEFEPGAINLQSNILDTPPIAPACGSEDQNESSFRIIGRGGLPPRPSDARTAPFLSLPWLERQSPPEGLDRSPSPAETDTSSIPIPPTPVLDLETVSFTALPSPRSMPFPQCPSPRSD
ncbi:MAG: proprotein convertase P-domain-containing protein [Leptolyngbyaceae bacterium]|nr:proprotein convertase P-domain-containing protein [Leptolyngbyaceae bacterium]